MVKIINCQKIIDVLPTVKVQISARKVKVTGPRGTLTKSFKHIDCDLRTVSKGRKILLEIWFASSQAKSCLNTVTSTITNMMVGVTQGYQYKMRFAHAHFPIKVNFPTEDPKTGKKIKEGSLIEIRNFLGELIVRRVYMRPGVECKRSEDVKDEITLQGNDLNYVSQTAAEIHQSCLVKRKDIRKFLDGVYVSESGPIAEEEE
mmetsp:Transcript_10548/g.15868  ORF Transcript_10548/g.15868 Transcript_10548/m.15868 type:complete len:203 (-) Transcript_10548:62-670(-)